MSKEEIHREILMKAGELFLRFGIKSISMDDISRQLAMSKKTIYQYFSDKEELIKEYFQHYFEKQKEDLLAIKAESKNVIDELVKSTSFMKVHMASLNPTVVYDLKKYHSGIWRLFDDFKLAFLSNYIRESLQEGINDGYFRKDIDIDILTRLRLEQIEMGFNPEIFPSKQFNLGKVQIEMFEHFLYGISTLKGHKLINKYKEVIEDEE